MKKILYKHTKKGLYTDIYKNQVYNSKKRGHNPPEYTKIKLIEWINNQKHFELLFKNWKDSNFSSDLKPSVDRLNDYKGYTFNNIQLLTWKENNQKAYSDKINSINKKTVKSCNKI